MKTFNQILFVAFIFKIVSCGSGQDSVDKCIDPAKINEAAICTREYAPVCGCDSKTYGNACVAENAGILEWKEGACEND